MNPLAGLIGRRLAFGLLTLTVISLMIFLGVEALPGDFAQSILGQSATPEAVAALRQELRLDLPAHVRYLDWIGGVLGGDLGVSLANHRSISELVGERLFNTLFLAGVAAFVAIPLALGLGIVAALWRDRALDRVVSVAALVAISFPEFFVGYMLIALLAVQLDWFPSVAMSSADAPLSARLYAIALPALTLSLTVVGYVARMTRAAIVDVLSATYIETARLKGLRTSRIVLRHSLPNALSPIIYVVMLNLAYLVVGVVVVEVVFAYPGLGQLLVDAVGKRDLPLVQACCLIFASTYVVLNLLADVFSILANPRLRLRR